MSNNNRKLEKKSRTCYVINYFIDANIKQLELLKRSAGKMIEY